MRTNPLSKKWLSIAVFVLIGASLGCATSTGPQTESASTTAALDPGAPTSPATSDAAVVTRVYDVRDLLVPVQNFDDAPDLRMAIRPADAGGTTRPTALFGSPITNRQGRSGGLGHADHQPPTRAQLINDVIQLLQETVASDTWRETGGTIGTIRELSGCLVVTQTMANQREIAQILEQLRETRGLQVTVETRFITVNDAALRQTGVGAWESAAFPSTAPTFLDDQKVKAILRAAQSEETSEVVVPAPRLTLFNGQRAYVAGTTEHEYVSDYKPLPTSRATTGPATLPAAFEPESSVVITGVVLDLSATVSADRKWVTLGQHLQLSKLQGFDEVPWPGRPQGSNLAVQQPQIGVSELRTAVSIPDKRTLLLGGLEDPGDHPEPAATQPNATRPGSDQPHTKGRLFILIKPTIIFPPPREAVSGDRPVR